MELEALASLAVLVANGIFIIVAVAGYLRMNGHEEQRQRYLSHALHDSREAGRDLKLAARQLLRLLHRLERQGLATRRGRSPRAESLLDDDDGDAAEVAADDPELERLSPPSTPPGPDGYAEWRRLQQVELARLLQQRRHLLKALEKAQTQLSQARRGRSPAEAAPVEALDESREALLARQLLETQAQLQRSLVEKDFIGERLLKLDAAERAARQALATADASLESAQSS